MINYSVVVHYFFSFVGVPHAKSRHRIFFNTSRHVEPKAKHPISKRILRHCVPQNDGKSRRILRCAQNDGKGHVMLSRRQTSHQ